MARALARQGIQVDVATTNDGGAGRRNGEQLGTALERDGYRLFQFQKQTEFYKVSLPLSRWVARHVTEYDVVHVHALFSHAPTTAASHARARGVPYIVRPLGVLNAWGMRHRRPGFKTLSFRFRELPLLRRAAAIHYTSRAEQREAESIGAPTRGVIVSLGIDLEPFREPSDPSPFLEAFPSLRGRKVLLFLSRLDPKKGFDLLLPALERIRARHPEARLALAGSGSPDYEQSLREDLDRRGLAEMVVWTGFLQGALKRSALGAATAYILPSHSENFGIAAVEALASGTPCILTPGVAVAEGLQDLGAALVPNADSQSIAEAIDRLFSSPETASEIGSRGRAHAVREFSMDTMGLRLVDLYSRLGRDKS
jgi:glycosyltransferase involved in cell wall biosynthesis